MEQEQTGAESRQQVASSISSVDRSPARYRKAKECDFANARTSCRFFGFRDALYYEPYLRLHVRSYVRYGVYGSLGGNGKHTAQPASSASDPAPRARSVHLSLRRSSSSRAPSQPIFSRPCSQSCPPKNALLVQSKQTQSQSPKFQNVCTSMAGL